MNKVIKFLLTCMLFIISVESTTFASEENKEMDYIWNTKRDLLVLMITYPDYIKDIEKGVLYFNGNKLDIGKFLAGEIEILHDKSDEIEFDIDF